MKNYMFTLKASQLTLSYEVLNGFYLLTQPLFLTELNTYSEGLVLPILEIFLKVISSQISDRFI